MKILVTGDRAYPYPEIVDMILEGLDSLLQPGNLLTVIEGECPYGGADKFAAEWAIKNGEHIPVPADWKKYGKAAGPIRNQIMVDMKPDITIGFHNNIEASKGTKDCLDRSKKAGIKTILVSEW